MFICEKCEPKFGISQFESIFGTRSYGRCEGCGETASCVDSTSQIAVTKEGIVNKRLCCCIPNQSKLQERCQHNAEWIIVHGPSPDDYTESCTAHVGVMLTDAVEHRIYRIEEGP